MLLVDVSYSHSNLLPQRSAGNVLDHFCYNRIGHWLVSRIQFPGNNFEPIESVREKFKILFQVSHVSTVCEYSCGKENLTPNLTGEWAVLQVKSSMDYAHGSWLTTFMTGALNYQITHHLFPCVSQVFRIGKKLGGKKIEISLRSSVSLSGHCTDHNGNMQKVRH